MTEIKVADVRKAFPGRRAVDFGGNSPRLVPWNTFMGGKICPPTPMLYV